MTNAIRVYYGSKNILKAYCPECHCYAFVIDNELQCCGRHIVKDIRVTKVKRETQGYYVRKKSIHPKVRKEILDSQDGLCFYCGCKLNEMYITKKGNIRYRQVHYDHVIPWAYVPNNDRTNIVASCSECNLRKNDRIIDFDSGVFEERGMYNFTFR